MIAALHRAALLALALLAAGCANFSAISPGDSALTVEARVGAPGTVWKNADGSELWEYPQGFYAVQTFMVAFDPERPPRIFPDLGAVRVLPYVCGRAHQRFDLPGGSAWIDRGKARAPRREQGGK